MCTYFNFAKGFCVVTFNLIKNIYSIFYNKDDLFKFFERRTMNLD